MAFLNKLQWHYTSFDIVYSLNACIINRKRSLIKKCFSAWSMTRTYVNVCSRGENYGTLSSIVKSEVH